MKRRNFLATASAFAVGLPFKGAVAQSKSFLTMDSFPAGTSAGQLGIAFTQMVQKYLPLDIQVSIGKPSTKSALDAALRKVDIIISAPSINNYMQTKTAMFEKVENAPELAANLRNIMAYKIGELHMVAYEDSGITKLEDFKGKKVFLGPPGGAATNIYLSMVEAATGLVGGEDFEVMRYDWQSAETAFLDRQMDVYMIATYRPSPSIQQYAMVSPIRLIGLTEEQLAKPGMQAVLELPGRTVEVIPAGSYENQVNDEDIMTLGAWGSLDTHKWQDEELVYNMTKAVFDHLEEFQSTAAWMSSINRDTVFTKGNIPLHVGAYRYYKEMGFDVPADRIPPEA